MNKLLVISMALLLLLSTISIADSESDTVRLFVEINGNPNILGNVNVIYSYDLLDNMHVIEVPAVALNGILNNPNILSVEYDAGVSIYAPPNKCSPWPECKGGNDGGEEEPPQELPWGIDRIDAELSLNDGSGVTVCVVDTGIDRDHKDLQANIAGGKNFVQKGRKASPNKWDDDNGHGTHVAGTIAALDNTFGVVGVSSGASLLGVKVLDRSGSGKLSDVIAGIEYCVNQNADVISMSLGTSSDVTAMSDAVNLAYANGVLIVAAAGNDYSSPVSYPAAYDSVIAVSATTNSDTLASFSNIGSEVELAAPGVNILSTWNDGSYNTISGTSMATPHVSGVAALAIEANPHLSNEEIRSLLQITADDLGVTGRDSYFGYGLVDAQLQ